MKAFLTLIITSLICLQASALSEVERNLWKLSGGQLKPVVESWPLTVPSLTVDHSTSTASLIYGFGQTLGGATYYPTLTPQSSYAGPAENVRTDVGKVYYLGSATKLPGFDFIDYANPTTIRARMYMDTDGTVYFENETAKGINLSARPLTTTSTLDVGSVLLTNPTSRFLPIWTDFTGSVANNLALSAPWLAVSIGVGTLSIGAGTADHPGLLVMKSHATTANSGHGFNLSSAAFLIAGGEETEFIFQPYTPTGGVNTTYMGFHDASSVTAPVDAVMFNIVDMVIDGRTYSNSSTSTTTSSYTMTTGTWYRGKITINSAATSVTYTVYSEAGASLWTDTLTTNIPTGAGRVVGNGIVATNSNPGSAQNIAGIDFISVNINRVLTR